ncbi:EcsC family protein [Paenibacillus sp. N1-5-1-14]|uniref:EcsC family protein n=1 Tax=Paenibacillus radicibacter TaxID=2972488 RepID=UPI002159745A|nr:EcsC family protein [Paenibacillus radicibacter]MCR8642721.1 EcsC family protein [Paenibacillus radicibacter]
MKFEEKEQLLVALAEIDAWEKDQRSLWFWEKLGRLPFAILDKLTPKFMQDKIGQVIDEVGSYIQTGGQYLIQPKDIRKKLAKQADVSQEEVDADVELPLAVRDTVADDLSKSRSKFAFMQGATTGFGGIFTLAIDIPAVLGLSLKVLQEMAICYGFDPNDPAERIFIVKCMQFSSSDIVGKKAILDDLASFGDEEHRRQVASQLQGWKETVLLYMDNFGWKKIFQMVPIAGMVFGAFINKSTIEDVAEVGRMLYRKRRIKMMLETIEK